MPSRTLIEALPSPIWARDEAGKLDLRQCRLCARGRSQGCRRRGAARHRAVRPRRARRALPRARGGKALRRPAAGHRRRQPPHLRRARLSRPAAAAPASPSTPPKPRRMRAELSAHGRRAPPHARSACRPASPSSLADQRLVFYNAAYRSLWDLDAGFLDQGPTDSARARPAARRPQAAGAGRLPRSGRRSCTRPTARSKPRSTPGICRTAARCASSPRPIRKAA